MNKQSKTDRWRDGISYYSYILSMVRLIFHAGTNFHLMRPSRTDPCTLTQLSVTRRVHLCGQQRACSCQQLMQLDRVWLRGSQDPDKLAISVCEIVHGTIHIHIHTRTHACTHAPRMHARTHPHTNTHTHTHTHTHAHTHTSHTHT